MGAGQHIKKFIKSSRERFLYEKAESKTIVGMRWSDDRENV
jgi:hypothetical protein